MPDDLQQIVRRMVEAGESEQDIATVIQHYKPAAQAAPVAAPPAVPSFADAPMVQAGRAVVEGLKGAAKGAASTATHLGELVHRVPGVSRAVDTLYGQPGVSQASFPATQAALAPSNTAQKVGFGAEQVAEYLVPGAQAEKVAATVASKIPQYARLLPKMAAQSAAGAGVATAQGQDPTTAATLGAVVPAAGATVGAAVRKVGDAAEPLVRAAIKPTVTAMKRVAGAAQTGIDSQAERLVKFILENKVTTAGKARAILETAERELQGLLSSSKVSTDAPQRAVRYLAALERSASKQGLPKSDVLTIRNAAAEVLESGLGEDVITMVPKPHPTLLGPNGQPAIVLTPVTTRALRSDVGAGEALERARANSRWDTRKAWGEQKGAQTEASKAVERAERDAVKAAVPEAAPLLRKEGQAIQAAEVLDRMAFRAANRDAVSLPAHVVAAGEMASGRVPVVAFAANWLRNNQLKAGMWADALRQGVKTNNAKLTAQAMQRLGIAVPAQQAGQR